MNLSEISFWRVGGRGVKGYARGWWWSATEDGPPTTFRDCGSGPEPYGDYNGPFTSEAAAAADAAKACDEAGAEA